MSVPFSFDESAFEGGLADLLGDDEFGFGELSLLDGEPPSDDVGAASGHA